MKCNEEERNIDHQLQDYMDKNNELKLQILRKESEIDSKSALIKTLQDQLDSEIGILKTYERGRDIYDHTFVVPRQTCGNSFDVDFKLCLEFYGMFSARIYI